MRSKNFLSELIRAKWAKPIRCSFEPLQPDGRSGLLARWEFHNFGRKRNFRNRCRISRYCSVTVGWGMRQRILIVDDDPALMELLTLFLRSEEFEILSAADAATALALIQEQQLAALITDSLPGLRGLQITKAFRKKHPLGAIIFFTGLTFEDTSQQALAAGANLVLFKPVGLNEVVSALRRLLAKSA
jgi:CheY-like chemotaxis protein